MDDEETLTAYHESGHAVVGYALGATIDSIQLGGEADEWLPERFGDCRVNWGRIDPKADWQRQREILTVLAGPVAEMIYRSEPLHPAFYGPWQHDWQVAWKLAAPLIDSAPQRQKLLERLILQLKDRMTGEPYWSAIAALSDALLAHEWLETEDILEVLEFWFRPGS
jgi:hypothetical protein